MTRRVEPLSSCSTIGLATTMGLEKDDVACRYMQNLMLRGHLILVAHGWKIVHLKEFYPRSARLLGLNVNKGAEVCIRFREPGQKGTFLPFEEVLCTLLHEIAHCKYSRHDQYFWKLYAQLVIECERLEVQMALSRPGSHTPRFACGGRLGGSGPSGPAPARALLAAAAETRLSRSRAAESCACDSVAPSASTKALACARCGRAYPAGLAACDYCVDAIGVDGWKCARCAFHNYCATPHCEACGVARVPVAEPSPFVVAQIIADDRQPRQLLACGVLGALADALAPLLGERRWRVSVLEECSSACGAAAAAAVVAQADRCDAVRVRLRGVGAAAEFLPPAHAHIAALHQLAHRLESHHGTGFVVTWVALLLQHCANLALPGAPSAAKEVLAGVVGVTAQLERILVEQFAGRLDSQARLVGILDLECRGGTKRGRSPDGTSVGDIGSWNCVRCSFRNSGFLLCEVCGAAQPLISPLQPLLTGTRAEPFIIE